MNLRPGLGGIFAFCSHRDCQAGFASVGKLNKEIILLRLLVLVGNDKLEGSLRNILKKGTCDQTSKGLRRLSPGLRAYSRYSLAGFS